MIRVAEIISDTNIGGAGVLLFNRLKHSDRRRFDTVVILPKGSRLTPRFDSIGIKTLEIRGCKDRSVDIFVIPELCNLLKGRSLDIVNCHGCLSARIAARLSRVPAVIHTRHCIYPIKTIYATGLLKIANRTVDAMLGDRIIAVSPVVKKQLIKTGISKERISVIVNGAEELKRLGREEREEIRRRLGIPLDACVVTICARLEGCKDHKTFLDAAALLLKKNKSYRFLVVGGGSLFEVLRQYAKKLRIDDSVIFTGAVDDVTEYMNVTDINVNCSIGTETSSLALSEGMSLGIPAVVSDYGGNPYMIRTGNNGFIFRRGNAQELARKITMLEDPVVYQCLSSGARRRFEKELNASRMTVWTEKLYSEIVAKLRQEPR